MTSASIEPSRRCFLVTRDYGPRSLFRRPPSRVVEVVRYGIAVAVKESEVSLHEFGIEAQRVRLVLSASERQLETFVQCLDAVVTELAGGAGSFWSAGRPHQALPLEDDAEVVQACVDVIAPASVRVRRQ